MRIFFKRKRLSVAFASFLLCIISANLFAAERGFYEAMAQFVKVIYLNAESPNGGDKICVYGSDNVSINIINDGEIVDLEDGDFNGNAARKAKLKKCRLIYVAKDKERFVKTFVDEINRSGALTLATFANFVNDGGMLFIDIGRRNFELTVNAQVFKKSGVKLDSAITGLIINKK